HLQAQTGQESFHQALLESLPQAAPAEGLGAELRLLRETFRSFADKRIRPLAEGWHRQDQLIPDALIAEAAALGCFGLSIPVAYGGAQERPDTLGMVVVTEELCRGALAFGSLITRPEILARALLKGGTEAQRRAFLPTMASGEKMVAISVTEPDFGSDVARITCAARRTPQGWRISGTKMWSTFAGRAELIGMLARTDPDPGLGYKGLSMFVVEKPAYRGHDFEYQPPGGGRLAGRAIATLGYRGMHSYELQLEDFLVPEANLVGGEPGLGRGFYLQMDAFSYGRLQTAARALGVMQAAWEAASQYAQARTVFGRSLAQYSLTREKLARMAAQVHACRQAAYATARLLDEPAEGGGAPGQMEASLVKMLACRQAEWVTREAQQLHGGMGYAEEFAVSRLYVDARVLSIFEGTDEVLALRVVLPALLKSATD
ncbi:MAG TPA: acyl-CoA dehydrogenase family protein, partial [bacterium]|nr:acyl-CoA dehydrogenase family protein [bacterium]